MRETSAWQEVRLGDLVRGIRGVSYRPENLLEVPSASTVTLLRSTNIQNSRLTFQEVQFVPEWLVSPSQILEPGDIAVCMSNGSKALVGKAARFEVEQTEKFTVGAFCSVFKPIRRSEAEFAFHLFNSERYQWHVDLALAGSAINNLKNSSIENLILRVPVDVQHRKRIAAVLSSIDTAIDRTEALICKHQHIKAGLMQDLFTRGVLPDGTLRPPRERAPELYQVTSSGWIPVDWEASTAGAEFWIDSGITLGPHRRPAANPHRYLRVANVHREEISLEDVARLERLPGDVNCTLNVGDLLLVEGHANPSEIGRCAMVPEAASGYLFQNHLFRLRPKRLQPGFSLRWLNSQTTVRYWERNCSTSSGLNTINRRLLSQLPVHVPAPEEQIAIQRRAVAINSQLETERQVLRKLQNQKAGLMQDLLTGRVSVEHLVPDLAHA